MSTHFADLREVSAPRVETRLIAEIDKCYAHSGSTRSLSFYEEWADSEGNRYLTFDIEGVEDVAFVAVVDLRSRITKVGLMSTNWSAQ